MRQKWGRIMRVTTKEDAARYAEIMRRIKRTGISDRDLQEKSGVSRGTIGAARKGDAGPGTYDRLEQWVERFEAEAGMDEPDDDIVEFVVTGNFGVSVTVRGPVSHIAELEESALRATREMGDQGA